MTSSRGQTERLVCLAVVIMDGFCANFLTTVHLMDGYRADNIVVTFQIFHLFGVHRPKGHKTNISLCVIRFHSIDPTVQSTQTVKDLVGMHMVQLLFTEFY